MNSTKNLNRKKNLSFNLDELPRLDVLGYIPDHMENRGPFVE